MPHVSMAQKVGVLFQRNRTIKAFPPKVIDTLAKAGIRFSFTRDLRLDLGRPENHMEAQATAGFMLLFRNDPRIVRREIVNFELTEKEDKKSLQYLPDWQTQIHLTRLFTQSGISLPCNLANDNTFEYIKNPTSPFYRVLQYRNFADVMKGRNFGNVSVHLGFAAEECDIDSRDGHSVPKTAVLRRKAVLSKFVTTLLWLKRNCEAWGYAGKILLETLDYQVDAVNGRQVSAYEHVTDPLFLFDTLRAVNGIRGESFALLLDAAHLLISAENMGIGYMEYVDMMLDNRAGLLQEMHVAVPQQTPERWLNNHQPLHANLDLPATEKLFHIIQFLLEKRLIEDGGPIIINFETPVETVDLDAIVMVMFLRDMLGF